MSDSLPERPDLDQLRRQAKELRDAARRADAAAWERFTRHHPPARRDPVSLAAAQLVIARELGFSSWPKLKAAVDADAVSRLAASAFLAASVEGRMRQAGDIFRADPSIASRSLLAASVLGDAEAVAAMLAADSAAAVAIDDERGWPPLLYACYSRWHQIDQSRAPGLAEVVRILLHAGASPNTNDGGRLSGAIKLPSGTSDLCALLPPAARPAHILHLTVFTFSDETGTLRILPNGKVFATSLPSIVASRTLTSLAAISYPRNS